MKLLVLLVYCCCSLVASENVTLGDDDEARRSIPRPIGSAKCKVIYRIGAELTFPNLPKSRNSAAPISDFSYHARYGVMFFVSPGIAGKSGIKVAYVKVDDYPDLSKVKPYPSLKKNTLITCKMTRPRALHFVPSIANSTTQEGDEGEASFEENNSYQIENPQDFDIAFESPDGEQEDYRRRRSINDSATETNKTEENGDLVSENGDLTPEKSDLITENEDLVPEKESPDSLPVDTNPSDNIRGYVRPGGPKKPCKAKKPGTPKKPGKEKPNSSSEEKPQRPRPKPGDHKRPDSSEEERPPRRPHDSDETDEDEDDDGHGHSSKPKKQCRHPFISIYASYIDMCDRLWLLERGTSDGKFCRAPAIYLYDLKPKKGEIIGRKLIARIEIPENLFSNANGFHAIVVDANRKQCDKAVVYIANVFDNSLIVYLMATNRMDKYTDPSFESEPADSRVVVGQVPYTMNTGLRAVTTGPSTSQHSRKVLYSAGGSTLLHSFPSRSVLKRTLSESDFEIVGNRGCNHQTPDHVYHLSYNTYFYGDLQTGKLQCASGNKYFSQRNIATVYHDPSNPAYPARIHMDHKGNIFIMYSDIDRFELGKIKPRNMRTTIVRCKASIVEGTVCDSDTARTGLMGLLGLKPHERYTPENVYENDEGDDYLDL